MDQERVRTARVGSSINHGIKVGNLEVTRQPEDLHLGAVTGLASSLTGPAPGRRGWTSAT